MPDNQPQKQNIPVLKEVVVPVMKEEVSSAPPPVEPEPSLLSSTLQAEIDAIINQARADFEGAIAQLQKEMRQRVERELNELHVQLTSDD